MSKTVERQVASSAQMKLIAVSLDYVPAGDREYETCVVGYFMENSQGERRLVDVQVEGRSLDSDGFPFFEFEWASPTKVKWKRDWLHGYFEAGQMGKMPHREVREMVFDFDQGCPSIVMTTQPIDEPNGEHHFSYSALSYVFSYDFKSDRLTIGRRKG